MAEVTMQSDMTKSFLKRLFCKRIHLLIEKCSYKAAVSLHFAVFCYRAVILMSYFNEDPALKSVNLKFIADAPDRFKRPLVGYALELFAQSLYMNVHRAGIAVVIKAPDLVE